MKNQMNSQLRGVRSLETKIKNCKMYCCHTIVTADADVNDDGDDYANSKQQTNKLVSK